MFPFSQTTRTQSNTILFLEFKAYIHLHFLCGMNINGVVHSIKGCVGILDLHHYGTLCHHVVIGRIISKDISKDDIILIESCQLLIVPRYGTVITVSYFDRNN